MNPYTMKVTCAICGGEGVATPSTAASEWLGAKLIHTDSRICLRNIERKRKEEQLKKDKV